MSSEQKHAPTPTAHAEPHRLRRPSAVFGGQDSHAVPWVSVMQTGLSIVHNPKYNKGTAFTEQERRLLRITGLLPPVIETQDDQVKRVMHDLKKQPHDLAKYIALQNLATRNERLFYRVLQEDILSLMPIVYTPTVGLACLKLSHIYRQSQGLYISMNQRGHVLDALYNWPNNNVRGIVFTDGERILGLGDQGANGMGIPIGKISLYTACAGIDPSLLLPVTIDVGTNNKYLLNDPLYLGLRQERDRTDAYDELIDEFIHAVKKRFGPYTLLQFEDFGNRNAHRLLEKYRDQCCTFNDDIQGTAAVTLGGILGSLKITNTKLVDHRFLIFGAGEAGLGIATLIVQALVLRHKVDEAEARKHVFLVDSRGLITKDRPSGNIGGQKAKFAHEFAHHGPGLEAIVKAVKPTVLVGVTAQPKSFTKGVCEAMAANADRPLIFPLSNPTSKAECTAEEAYTWTGGKCIFASGSPFDPVKIGDKTYIPGQGNNAYIFPGISLAIIASGARRVTDEMFLVSAEALAEQVTDAEREVGRIYPPLETIRDVSAKIATAVANEIYNSDLATFVPRPDDMLNYMYKSMYSTEYPTYA